MVVSIIFIVHVETFHPPKQKTDERCHSKKNGGTFCVQAVFLDFVIKTFKKALYIITVSFYGEKKHLGKKSSRSAWKTLESTVGQSCLWRLGCWSPESWTAGLVVPYFWRGQCGGFSARFFPWEIKKTEKIGSMKIIYRVKTVFFFLKKKVASLKLSQKTRIKLHRLPSSIKIMIGQYNDPRGSHWTNQDFMECQPGVSNVVHLRWDLCTWQFSKANGDFKVTLNHLVR